MGCLGEQVFCSQTLHKLAKQLPVFTKTNVRTGAEKELDEHDSKLETMEPVANSFPCPDWRKRRAAVLICLFEGDGGELRVILTKRSMKLSSHPGDVALPGGKMEEGDSDDSATALREAMEEIGLDPGHVQVITNLEPFTSQNQLSVVPVVGLLARIEDFTPVLNTHEVDAVFDVPLEMFLLEENYRSEEREWMGRKYILHLFDFKSEQGTFLVWGLTASILIRAASVIYQRHPSFKFSQSLPDFQQLQKSLKDLAIQEHGLNVSESGQGTKMRHFDSPFLPPP